MTTQEIKTMLRDNMTANREILDTIESLEHEIERVKEVVLDQDSMIGRLTSNYNKIYYELQQLKLKSIAVPIRHADIDRVHDEIMPMPPVHSDRDVGRIPPESSCESCEPAYPEQVEVDDVF